MSCSALTVLASSSGVTAERQAFMGLVKNEIDRLNASERSGKLSMVFRSGGVTVSLSPYFSLNVQLSGTTFKLFCCVSLMCAFRTIPLMPL